MNTEHTTRQTGFTLIELLLYVSIVGTLLIAMSMFFGLSVDARIKNQSIAEVEQQGMATMEYITQTLRGATTISAPAIGASAASLTAVVPTGALSPTIFDLSAGSIRVKEGAGSAIPLTNSDVTITSLNFDNMSRSSSIEIVQVSFTLSRTNTANRNEYDYQKTFTSSVALR
jgi:type II secretory pathway pseudopilin PulG